MTKAQIYDDSYYVIVDSSGEFVGTNPIPGDKLMQELSYLEEDYMSSHNPNPEFEIFELTNRMQARVQTSVVLL